MTTSGIGRSQQRRVVEAELLGDGVPLVHRIARGAVHDADQHAGALDVAQEVVAQPAPLVRALDEPRHVGDDAPLRSSSSAMTPRFGVIVVNG